MCQKNGILVEVSIKSREKNTKKKQPKGTRTPEIYQKTI